MLTLGPGFYWPGLTLISAKNIWFVPMDLFKYRLEFQLRHHLLENEATTGFLDHFWAIYCYSVNVCGSKLSVSPFENQFQYMKTIFSDYDLSLVCTSRCDDDYVQCVSVCNSTDCLLDCNRAAVAYAECTIISLNFWF